MTTTVTSMRPVSRDLTRYQAWSWRSARIGSGTSPLSRTRLSLAFRNSGSEAESLEDSI
jgi:hypothetical protein